MKTFGLAAIILVLAGSSFAFAQEVPKPATVVEPTRRPRSILPPQTPAEKMMRKLRNDFGRRGPVEIFSPQPSFVTGKATDLLDINGSAKLFRDAAVAPSRTIR
jgi:hypothetical protein